jgi:hypothetical protein
MRQSRSAWADRIGAFVLLLSILPVFVLATEKDADQNVSPSPSPSVADQTLANIPLVVGHEAKGIVLPDFDLEGHLRGKFEAGMARRIDQDHIGFRGLKITTYTAGEIPDLLIEMKNSVLDLQTRVLTSKERTEIKRHDFSIAGDSLEFDTKSRTGRLIGNVKMVITDQSHFIGKTSE